MDILPSKISRSFEPPISSISSSLVNSLLNDKKFSLQTITDIYTITDNLTDDQYKKLLHKFFSITKSSLLHCIVLKKINLTENDLLIIQKILDDKRFDLSYIVLKALGSLLKMNNITSLTKHNYNLKIYEMIIEKEDNVIRIASRSYKTRNIIDVMIPIEKQKQLGIHNKIITQKVYTSSEDELSGSDEEILFKNNNFKTDKTKKEIDKTFILSFQKACHKKDVDKIIKAYDRLIEKAISNSEFANYDMRCLLHNFDQNDIEKIMTHLITNGFEVLESDMYVINEMMNKSDVIKALIVSKLDLINNFNNNYSFFGNKILEYKNEFSLDEISLICDIESEGAEVLQEQLLKILDKIVLKEQESLNDLMLIACRQSLHLVVNKLIEKGVSLDETHLYETIKNGFTENILKTFLNNKIFVNKEFFKRLIETTSFEDVNEDINLLITFGLIFDLECIEILIQNKLIIDLEQFGFEFDDTLFGLCYEHDFFPGDYVKKFFNRLGKQVIIFRELCKYATYNEISKFMEKHDLVIDKFCLLNILDFNFNCCDILKEIKYFPKINDVIKIKNDKNRMKVYEIFYKKVPLNLE